MNQLVISLIVLLIPGLIAAFVYDAITEHEKWNNFDFSVAAVLFGWFSYLPLYVINSLFRFFAFLHIKFQFGIFDTLLKLLNENSGNKTPILTSPVYIDIVTASAFALIIAFLAAACVNYKILTRLARYLRVSDKYGDENLFSYYLNSKEIDWVYIRCKTQALTYRGKISNYSEIRDIQEIVLLDADIYNYDDSAFLHHANRLYLCGKAGDFIIELAEKRSSETAKGKTDE